MGGAAAKTSSLAFDLDEISYYLSISKYDVALDVLKPLIAEYSDNKDVMKYMGFALIGKSSTVDAGSDLEEELYRKSIEYIEKALLLGADDEVLYLMLGIAYNSLGFCDKANPSYARYYSLRANRIHTKYRYYILGWALCIEQAKSLDNALREIRTSIEATNLDGRLIYEYLRYVVDRKGKDVAFEEAKVFFKERTTPPFTEKLECQLFNRRVSSGVGCNK